MKLNLGCGNDLREGWVNVDRAHPRVPISEGVEFVLHDLEASCDGFPLGWPWWQDNSVDEVCFHHSLEHMGATAEKFCVLIQELYRVCKPGARIEITVPHPRSDGFLGDPTHVRVITPQTLALFDRENCDRWAKMKAANTPLAYHWGVDFKTVSQHYGLMEPWASRLEKGEITEEELLWAAHTRNNVVAELQFVLEVRK